MTTILLLLPAIAAVVVLLIALKKNYNRNAFFISLGITLVGCSLFLRQMTLYELICGLSIPLAAIYVGFLLYFHIKAEKAKEAGEDEMMKKEDEDLK